MSWSVMPFAGAEGVTPLGGGAGALRAGPRATLAAWAARGVVRRPV
ncbi:MAG: hypothetical protein JW751_04735 [Polyangiaceae bacterium]|nr:hypothetical protein [Polyangiaceae bacterium]